MRGELKLSLYPLISQIQIPRGTCTVQDKPNHLEFRLCKFQMIIPALSVWSTIWSRTSLLVSTIHKWEHSLIKCLILKRLQNYLWSNLTRLSKYPLEQMWLMFISGQSPTKQQWLHWAGVGLKLTNLQKVLSLSCIKTLWMLLDSSLVLLPSLHSDYISRYFH